MNIEEYGIWIKVFVVARQYYESSHPAPLFTPYTKDWLRLEDFTPKNIYKIMGRYEAGHSFLVYEHGERYLGPWKSIHQIWNEYKCL